jgi:hypothetical protein
MGWWMVLGKIVGLVVFEILVASALPVHLVGGPCLGSSRESHVQYADSWMAKNHPACCIQIVLQAYMTKKVHDLKES